MAFNFAVLESLLVCPASRTPLVHEGDTLVCSDPDCRLQYAIRDEIPIMLVDEAVKLPVESWNQTMQRHGRDLSTGQPRDKIR